jgi:hypothetical protein
MRGRLIPMGTKENIENFRKVNGALDAAGVRHVAYEAPGTAPRVPDVTRASPPKSSKARRPEAIP